MTPQTAHDFLIPATLALFSPRFNSPHARAMLLTIGLQESDFLHRRQLIGHHRNWWESIKGPATGFWQFERIGIRGVMEHQTTGNMLRQVCDTLGYPMDVGVLHGAVVHNDVLAVAIARLALWREPRPLPGPTEPAEAWRQYLSIWRPGKPSPERWNARYRLAWSIVQSGTQQIKSIN